MSDRKRSVVAIIGAAVCTPEQAEAAAQVGRLLARAGVVVLCGGRGGVMEAVCRGVDELDGISIGLLPGMDPQQGNSYLGIALPTGLGNARNALIAQGGSAVIAIGGGYGTLSEIGLALKAGIPVIGLHTWEATAADGRSANILPAESPEQAVDLALKALRKPE